RNTDHGPCVASRCVSSATLTSWSTSEYVESTLDERPSTVTSPPSRTPHRYGASFQLQPEVSAGAGGAPCVHASKLGSARRTASSGFETGQAARIDSTSIKVLQCADSTVGRSAGQTSDREDDALGSAPQRRVRAARARAARSRASRACAWAR